MIPGRHEAAVGDAEAFRPGFSTLFLENRLMMRQCFPERNQEVKMACFTAPLAAAVAAGIARRTVAKESGNPETISWAAKLGWLEKLSFGGCALLAFEHIWHGEIIFQFPFLTGVRDGNTAEVLKEIATVGGAMTALILAVWIGMLIVSSAIVKRTPAAVKE